MKAEHQHQLHQRVAAQNNRTSLAGGSTNSSNTSNQPFSHNGLASRPDLFIQSESPLEQEIHLHQKLKEHIKNSSGRRYGSSELYLAKTRISNNQNHYHNHHERSPMASSCSGPSEVQSTTLNIGGGRNSTSSNTLSGENTNLTRKPTSNNKSTQQQNVSSIKEHQQQVDSSTTNSDSTTTNEQQQMVLNNINLSSSSSESCRVCLIKEVRRELVNINKMVQESNEEISKMKAKCLRSYFERQMKD